MAKRDIIVIGASAGGLQALQQLKYGLPAELDAALLVVLHTFKHSGNVLPNILNRYGRFRALHPKDGASIEKGRMYIAPPDFHMIVEAGRLRVTQGPRENRYRPAIDALFRSAAAVYGPRVIGVVLTGLLDDGSTGLMVVRAAGGQAIVQDPDTALYSSMPRSALRQVPDAHVVPLEEIPGLLLRLTQEYVLEDVPRRPGSLVAASKRTGPEGEADMPETRNEAHTEKPSQITCPECGGRLWEVEDGGSSPFRGRVEHALTTTHLDTKRHSAVQTALWAALRALEDRASHCRRLAERARHGRLAAIYEEYDVAAREKGAQADILREFLLDLNSREENLPPLQKSA